MKNLVTNQGKNGMGFFGIEEAWTYEQKICSNKPDGNTLQTANMFYGQIFGK